MISAAQKIAGVLNGIMITIKFLLGYGVYGTLEFNNNQEFEF